MKVVKVVGAVFFVLLVAAGAFAQEINAAQNAITIDTVWMLVCAFLVFFMQAGFAMVETGFTQAKNASNILMKNPMDFAIGSLAYWAMGFAIMFGKDLWGLKRVG